MRKLLNNSNLTILLTLTIFLQGKSQVNYFPWTDQQIVVSGAVAAAPNTDVITDANVDKLYFIDANNRVSNYYMYNSVWYEAALDNSAALATPNSGLVFDQIWKLYYVGQDGYIHTFFNNGVTWQSNVINGFISGSPAYVPAIAGSRLAISFPGGYAKVYYTGTDNKIHYVLWTNTGWTNGMLNTTSFSVRANSSITTDIYEKVYYVGTDNQIRNFAPYGVNWYDGPLNSNSMPVRNLSDIVIDENGKVYYVGATDNRIHCFSYTISGWQETVVDANSIPVASGSNFTYNNGSLNYLGTNNQLNVTYWDGCTWRSKALSGGGSTNVLSGAKWKSRYYNSIYGNSYYFDNTGKPHLLIPGVDYTSNNVYVKENKLMLSNTPFYVKGINYVMDLNHYTKPHSGWTGEYHLSRYSKYCGCCIGKCTYDPAQAIADINTDFSRIHTQGYNTVRIAGFGVNGDAVCPTSLYIGGTQDYYYGPPYNWGNAPENIAINTTVINAIIADLKLVLKKAYNNNLKVIICTGFGNGKSNSIYPAYQSYLSTIASAIKNDPDPTLEQTLMAIDFFNEPLFTQNCNVVKSDVCTNTKNLYNAIRGTGSKSLLTIGLEGEARELWDWDPAVISADFFSPHFYLTWNENLDSPVPIFNSRLDNFKSNIIYFSQLFRNKPWMAGEMGFSSDMYDLNNLAGHGFGSYSELKTMAQDATALLNQVNSSGFLWWDYHDTNGSGSTYGEYEGIYSAPSYPATINDDILKTDGTTSLSSILTGASSGCSTGVFTTPPTYYNYNNNSSANTYNGIVIDQNSNPINNAFIYSWDHGEFTYSKPDGSFSLKTSTSLSYGITIAATGKINLTIAQPLPASGTTFQLFNETCVVSARNSNTATGITTMQNIKENDMLIFPNPSSIGIYNVKINSVQETVCKIEVFNSIGQLVESFIMDTNNIAKIDISNNVPGIYFVKATVNGKISTTKIIK